MHPAWAAQSDLAPPVGSPSSPSTAQPRSPRSPTRCPAPSTHPRLGSTPFPPSPPPSFLISVSLLHGLGGPKAPAPTPHPRSQPPALPTPSSRQPGSQRSAGPRSPCVLRGWRRGEAASAAGEWGGAEAQTETRRLGERRRGGRDGAWTAVDTASRTGQSAAHIRGRVPGTKRDGPGGLRPSMHRAPSPTADKPSGGGDSARRTPQPRLKLVSKGR